MTVNDLIVASLRRLRVISGADPPSGDDMNDALLRLQDWLDDLRTQDFLNLFEAATAWPLVAGKQAYQVPDPAITGLANAPAFANMQEIHNIGYLDAQNNTVLLPVLTDDAYERLPNKLVQASLPSYWYFRGGPGAVGNLGYRAQLFPWPIPNTSALQGVMFYAQPVGQMTLTTVLDGNANLPPGWRRFLRDGLAVELAPEFHVEPDIVGPLKASADEAMRNIKRKKRPLRDLAVPEWFGLAGGGNIYTGS